MSRRGTRFAWTLAIAVVLLYALARIALNPLEISNDSALYVQAGAMVLDHDLPYVGVVDTNPPLILYIHAVPAQMARVLDTHPIPTFLVFVWLLTLLSIAATRRALANSLEPDESIHADFLALGLALFSIFLLGRVQYGQREHLFVLGLFPYLVFRFRHWNGGTSSALSASLAGVCGAAGACLKPYFLVIALTPEIYWLLRRRSARAILRPEVVALVATCALYALYFLLASEAMRSALFQVWLPLIIRGYSAYNAPLQEIIVYRTDLWLPPLACVFVFFLRPVREAGAWRFAETLAVVAIAGVFSFFVQHKGWSYHAIPAEAAMFAVAALFLAETGARSTLGTKPSMVVTTPARAVQSVLFVMAAGLASLVVFLTTQSMVRRRVNDAIETKPIARSLVEHTKPGDPVLFIATHADYAYPTVVQLDRRPGSRFLLTFPIALIYAGETAAPGQPFPYHGRSGVPVPEAERVFRRNLQDDIQRRRPRLIAIDAHARCQGCPDGFVIHDYLMRTGFIDEALGSYRPAGQVDNLMVYLLEVDSGG